MKLHGLMLQHHDDLGRIIVSFDVHLDAKEKSAQKRVDTREWQDLDGREGRKRL